MKTFLIAILIWVQLLPASAQKSTVHLTNGIYQLNQEAMEAPGHLQSLFDSLEHADLKSFSKTKDVPQYIKKFYQDTQFETLDVADKDGDYNCCCDIMEGLPDLQLQYLGYNNEIALPFLL